jgi:nucleoside-diphosphate-sugar epimerase
MSGPILLTGGSGFLGSHIADRLAASGIEIRALVRATSDIRHLSSLPGVELVRGRVEDLESLTAAVRGVRGIIHAAGLIKARRSDDFRRVNAVGTENLLEAVRIASPDMTRLVYVSSLTAVGPSTDGRPRPTGASPGPVTAYGRSKLSAEESVRGASGNMPTAVVRPSVVHGPRDRETLAFFQAVKLGILPLTGSPQSVLSMVYCTDCADACVRALDAEIESGLTFDLEDGQPETLETLVEHIEAALDRRVRIRIPIPESVLNLAALATEAFGFVARRPVMLTRDKVRELRAPHWVCDASAAQAALGWTPQVPFSEGARRSAAWYREAGWL